MKIGRITEAHRTNFTVTENSREYIATVRGVFHADGDFPKVGDYVSFDILGDEKSVIEKVMKRKSIIKRKESDGEGEQIIASNVDLIFIVMGLDGDFNISRLERYLLLAEQSNIPAIVILNKTDVSDEYLQKVDKVKTIVGKTPVLAVSALTGVGMGDILKYLSSESTSVLLGSSGAGKSTITNWLLSEDRQEVNDIRAIDSRGRHTTTSRQLFTLPQGGFLIDTPGMRELGVLESDTGDEVEVFNRIEEFSRQCKFNNCDHDKSAGCVVVKAIDSGDLTERELRNYHKLLQERDFSERKDIKASVRYESQNTRRRKQIDSVEKRKRFSKN